MRGRTCLCVWLAVLILVAVPSRAADQAAAPLTVFIEDGEVLFQGADLDLGELKAKLTATGRQKDRIYFRMGPNAKTAYVEQVIEAIKAAGFNDIAVAAPPGIETLPQPPV
jgi:biopolymer transport protein ExbD